MELKFKASLSSAHQTPIIQCRKPKIMETRRENVRWGKEAGAGLPGFSSGLVAASSFLAVHREPPTPALGCQAVEGDQRGRVLKAP